MSVLGFQKVIGQICGSKTKKQWLLTAKTTFFAQEGPELQISGKWGNTQRNFDTYWRSSSVSSPGVH